VLAARHRHVGATGNTSPTYIALFSHVIPCGVWEAVYIIEGLLRNESDVRPDTIHADSRASPSRCSGPRKLRESSV
jgi:hypothetical protein